MSGQREGSSLIVESEVPDERKITQDMLSTKFSSFMKEGKGTKHIYKMSVLTSKYNDWIEEHDYLDKKTQNMIMIRKKLNVQLQPIALEETQSHIKWIKFVSMGLIACIRSIAVVLSSGYYFFLYDVVDSKWKIFSCCNYEAVDGVGCLAGSKVDNIFAFSEKCKGSRIFLINYPELKVCYRLKDRFGGKVMALEFGVHDTLISLKCILSEHVIVIWSWRTSKIIYNFLCSKPFLHPDILTVNPYGCSCATLGYNKDKQMLQFWNMNFCGEDSMFINRNTTDLNIENEIHNIIFSPDNILFLIDCMGNVYTFDYASKKILLRIPWIPSSVTVPDREQEKFTPFHVFNQSKGKNDIEYKTKLVDEMVPVVEKAPSRIEVRKWEEVQHDNDDFVESDDDEDEGSENLCPEENRRCHMILYDSGILVSGPDGRIKFFSKAPDGEEWVKMWGLIPVDPILKFVVTDKHDRLMGWSNKFGLMEILPDSKTCKILHFFGGEMSDMVFLNPLNQYILTISKDPVLYVWKKKSGAMVSYAALECETDGLAAHPSCPLVILKSATEGALLGCEMSDPRAPVLWPRLRLTREPIQAMSFLQETGLLAVLSSARKRLILIKVYAKTGFDVIGTYDTDEKILCTVRVRADDGPDRVLLLSEGVPAGDTPARGSHQPAGKLLQAIRYPRMSVEKKWASERFYRSVMSGPGVGQVLAVPADQHFHIHNFLITFEKAGGWEFLGSIRTEHQVGTFSMVIQGSHLLTYGLDGTVSCYEPREMYHEKQAPFCLLVPHHRYDGGIRRAIVDYKANYVVTMGRDGLLICSRIKLKNRCSHSFHDPMDCAESISDAFESFKHEEFIENYWEVVYERKKKEADALMAECLLKRIMDSFDEIKRIWHECYEENERLDPQDRLSWTAFDIMKIALRNVPFKSDNKIAEKIREMETTTELHKAWISRWKALCSEIMSKKLYKLKPFIANYYIENYNQAFKPEEFEKHERLLKMISDMDAAIFPIPKPNVFPWKQQDSERMTLSKEHLKTLTSVKFDLQEDLAIEETVGEEFMESEHSSQEKTDLLDRKKETQENVIEKLKLQAKKRGEKILYDELKKLRQFYKEKVKPLKEEMNPKTVEDDDDFTVREAEPRVKLYNTLSEVLIEDDPEGTVSKAEDADGQVEKDGKAELESVSEIVEQEEADGNEIANNEVELKPLEEDLPGEGQDEEEEEIFQDEADEGYSEEILVEKEESDSSSVFSWDQIRIGEKTEAKEIEEAKVEPEKKEKARKEQSILDFQDARTGRSTTVVAEEIDPMEEPFCMMGAQSLRLVDCDYLRCNEFTLNGIFMSDLHTVTLQAIMEELENEFNKKFISAHDRKGKDIQTIKKKNEILAKHIHDLVTVCRGKAPKDMPVEYDWAIAELLPFTVWEDPSPNEIPVKLDPDHLKGAEGREGSELSYPMGETSGLEEEALEEEYLRRSTESSEYDEDEDSSSASTVESEPSLKKGELALSRMSLECEVEEEGLHEVARLSEIFTGRELTDQSSDNKDGLRKHPRVATRAKGSAKQGRLCKDGSGRKAIQSNIKGQISNQSKSSLSHPTLSQNYSLKKEVIKDVSQTDANSTKTGIMCHSEKNTGSNVYSNTQLTISIQSQGSNGETQSKGHITYTESNKLKSSKNETRSNALTKKCSMSHSISSTSSLAGGDSKQMENSVDISTDSTQLSMVNQTKKIHPRSTGTSHSRQSIIANSRSKGTYSDFDKSSGEQPSADKNLPKKINTKRFPKGDSLLKGMHSNPSNEDHSDSLKTTSSQKHERKTDNSKHSLKNIQNQSDSKCSVRTPLEKTSLSEKKGQSTNDGFNNKEGEKCSAQNNQENVDSKTSLTIISSEKSRLPKKKGESTNTSLKTEKSTKSIKEEEMSITTISSEETRPSGKAVQSTNESTKSRREVRRIVKSNKDSEMSVKTISSEETRLSAKKAESKKTKESTKRRNEDSKKSETTISSEETRLSAKAEESTTDNLKTKESIKRRKEEGRIAKLNKDLKMSVTTIPSEETRLSAKTAESKKTRESTKRRNEDWKMSETTISSEETRLSAKAEESTTDNLKTKESTKRRKEEGRIAKLNKDLKMSVTTIPSEETRLSAKTAESKQTKESTKRRNEDWKKSETTISSEETRLSAKAEESTTDNLKTKESTKRRKQEGRIAKLNEDLKMSVTTIPSEETKLSAKTMELTKAKESTTRRKEEERTNDSNEDSKMSVTTISSEETRQGHTRKTLPASLSWLTSSSADRTVLSARTDLVMSLNINPSMIPETRREGDGRLEDSSPGSSSGSFPEGEGGLEYLGEGEASSKDMRMMQDFLEAMMGGAFQQTWQELLQEDIPIPAFLYNKDPENFTVEDVKIVQQFLKEKAERDKQIIFHRQLAESEIKKLTSEINKLVYKHDMDVMDVLKRRIMFDGCIQSEYLKILRMKQKRFIADLTLESIRETKDLIHEYHAEGMRLSALCKLMMKKTAILYDEIDRYQGIVRHVENDFMNKLEPLKLTKKITELLKSYMKKKPDGEAEKSASPAEMLNLGHDLSRGKTPPYLSVWAQGYISALDGLDVCPPGVGSEPWALVVQQRRLKLLSDLKCKGLQLLIREAEKTTSLCYKYFVAHLQRYDKLKRNIKDQKIRLQQHCNKLEILLPEGLIEAHQTGSLEDFKDCIYLNKKYIDNLNKEIVELQKEKGTKWKDFDKYMNVVSNAELLHKELQLRIKVKENLHQDIKTARINKYTKEFLADYQRKNKPNYEVKLRDEQKQDKIREMVRKYFQSYYRSINNIKAAQEVKESLTEGNENVSQKNDELAVENQKLLSEIENFKSMSDDEKRLKERNQAVIQYGKLMRKYEENRKKIESLEEDLNTLYLKNYPTFSINT